MARTPRGSRTSGDGASQAVAARAYTSPTLVLLAMDWPANRGQLRMPVQKCWRLCSVAAGRDPRSRSTAA